MLHPNFEQLSLRMRKLSCSSIIPLRTFMLLYTYTQTFRHSNDQYFAQPDTRPDPNVFYQQDKRPRSIFGQIKRVLALVTRFVNSK